MRWTLLLLLLLLLTARSQSLAASLQERLAQFPPTRRGSGDGGGGHTTDPPCAGLLGAGPAAVSLANRGLERLPRCLPRTLRVLDGSHNLLRALSAGELRPLPELRVLMLRHNRIAALRWGGGAPAALHTLDLSYNLLASPPPCPGPALRSLRTLALAGNPLQALPPRAFACFPALRMLNLSCSALGRGAHGAFVGQDGGPLAALEVLDLSGTYLERVESGWISSLPKLKSLYLRKMPRLRSLEADIFKMTPSLQQLDCQDSSALTSVHTHIFQDTPCLQVLMFQNCNLSTFRPWTMSYSQVLFVSLLGNPLTCSCELAWLLMDANRTVLHRAADTVCTPAAGSEGPFSGPLSLSQLFGVCKSDQSTPFPTSNPPSFDHSVCVQQTWVPSTGKSTVLSAQPGEGHQNVTEASSHTTVSLTQRVWSHSDALERIALSRTDERVPSRAASTVVAEHQGHAATHVLKPSISAASTRLARKHLSPFPTSPNPMNMSQHNQRLRSTHETVHSNPFEDEIPVTLLDDSEEAAGTQEEVGAPQLRVRCDYHPCKHLQTPCAELQQRLRCLCPGLSREDTIPDPPKLQEAAEVTDTSMLIRWCAPNSVVFWYHVHYSAEGGVGNQSVGNIYSTARQHPLYGLSPDTTYHVCVLAANRAGLSQPQTSGWRRSCTNFRTKPSSVIIFWGMCTTSSLLLLSTLVLSVCLCKQRWKPHRQCYDTHLVAFKNPAKDEVVAQW
uniref:Leucine rich repeat neuronal 4 n=1 Tax=Jaculus jaculus TaxID=51337 RepID=A0A8C5KZ55_JACJA